MKKPNFFIVGAPKCGTTALSSYLRIHENIFMTSPKEPHFFAKEFSESFYPCKTLNDYLFLYRDASEEHQAVGEASVLYLYSETAVKKIHDFNPDSKIVVMLRNPIDLAYSWHSQAVFNGDESILDFEKAWDLQAARRRGDFIPKTCRIPQTLQYEAVASLGDQVENLLKIFPKEQTHFVFLDDFKNDTLHEYRKVLSFLDISYDGKTEFPIINENKVRKSNKLHRLQRSRPVDMARRIKNKLGLKNIGVFTYANNKNTLLSERPALANEFRKQLQQTFLPQVEKIERLLGKSSQRCKGGY